MHTLPAKRMSDQGITSFPNTAEKFNDLLQEPISICSVPVSHRQLINNAQSVKSSFHKSCTVENGIIYFKIPEIKTFEKPKPNHLFLTVNANIIGDLGIDKKLTPKQQLVLKAGKEINYGNTPIDVKTKSILPAVQLLLENSFWDILNSNLLKNKIENLQQFQDYSYIQIVRDNVKERKKIKEQLSSTPDKNCIQNFLENTIRSILKKKLAENQTDLENHSLSVSQDCD